MPLVEPSSYRPPAPFRQADLNTIAASLRRVSGVEYVRERVELPDGDFLDLDWSYASGRNSRRLGIVSHGLEGSTDRGYMRGMARAFNRRGWDALCWNYRSCSGEPNRLPRFYHSGDTADLGFLVERTLAAGYESVALVGFSLGGNVTLKFVGELGDRAPAGLVAAAAVSTPVDLAAGAGRMMERRNRLYMQRFLRSLGRKVRAKAERFPDVISANGYERLRGFHDFDGRYTAPLHGFRDAEDYWTRSSARPLLRAIRLPTLIINAADDPFLAPSCYPRAEAKDSTWVYLEVPDHGGHVGFVTAGSTGEYWSEGRALSFITRHAEARETGPNGVGTCAG